MYEQKCITFIPTVSSAFWFIVHKFWMLTRIKRKIPKRMCAFIKRLKIISKSFWRLYGFVDYFTLKIHCSHYLNLRNIFFFQTITYHDIDINRDSIKCRKSIIRLIYPWFIPVDIMVALAEFWWVFTVKIENFLHNIYLHVFCWRIFRDFRVRVLLRKTHFIKLIPFKLQWF